MKSLVKLRREHEKVRTMLSLFRVMSQPSAFVDSVIHQWHLRHQQAQYPVSLAVRDPFTGAYSETSRLSMQVSGQMPSWISGGMTPVLQLTDTTAARQLKVYAKQSQERLRRELKQAAKTASVEPTYNCTNYEMLRISYEACQELKFFMDEQGVERTIRDSIKNGMLCLRPNWQTNKLEDVTKQPWVLVKPDAEKWSVGNNRLSPEWYKHRYEWTDDTGKPLLPIYDEPHDIAMSKDHLAAKKLSPADVDLELQVDLTYDDGDEQILEVCEPADDEQKQDLAVAADWVSRISSKHQFANVEVDALLSDQTTTGKQRKVGKKKQKALARWAARGKMLEDAKEALQVHSAKQVMEAIVPGSSKVLYTKNLPIR